MTPQNPPPGSDEAIQAGCSCPVIDNHYGRGYRGKPGIYVVTDDCKVHASRAACKLCGLEDGACICRWIPSRADERSERAS